jgi:hypothetical protein
MLRIATHSHRRFGTVQTSVSTNITQRNVPEERRCHFHHAGSPEINHTFELISELWEQNVSRHNTEMDLSGFE